MSYQIVGVMGPDENATVIDCDRAYALGAGIAAAGWVLLTGGRAVGVMEAARRGAKAGGGLTVKILPDGGESRSPYSRISWTSHSQIGNSYNTVLRGTDDSRLKLAFTVSP